MRCSLSRVGGILGLLLIVSADEAGSQVVLSPTRYDLDIDVDYEAEVLRGTSRIVVENPSSEAVRDASMLLYRLMHVTSVRGDHDQDLEFSQTTVVFDDFAKLQVNRILIALAEPLAPGGQTALEIRYSGPLLGYAETGMRYIRDRIDPGFTILRPDSYAYPEPGYPSFEVNRSTPQWSFSYTARITVPKGLTVANGGRLESVDSHGDRVSFRFSSLKPSWRMDFAIADYRELSSSPVRVYYLPGDSSGAAGVVQAAHRALGLFRDWFGPLRDTASLTFIEIPDGWGSQTDATAIIQSAAAFRDPRRHREVYHEISHLWNVSPADRPSPRWNEGLASFLEYLVTEQVTGEPVVDRRATQLVEWLQSRLPGHAEWKEVPLIDYGRANLTDLSYSVGALFFDLLYRLAGREAFNRIIGGYVAEHGALGGSTDDLMEVVSKSTEADLSQLITDWIYTTAWAERIEQSTDIEDLASYYRGRR